jgi:hypothetical protein
MSAARRHHRRPARWNEDRLLGNGLLKSDGKDIAFAQLAKRPSPVRA